MNAFTHDTFLSPFTWRYGSSAMRKVWSEAHKRRLLRSIWVALAEAQCEAGLVSEAQVQDLRDHQDEIDLERAHAIEAEIKHDLMAEVRTYAEQCSVGGGIIHLGATSMDILDNADALRIAEGLDVLLVKLDTLVMSFARQIEAHARTPTMAFTHLQPAEPTTIGYRLAQYGQDLLQDLEQLRRIRRNLRGKGLKGATGTSASYTQLLEGTPMTACQMEAHVMSALGMEAVQVATQVSPRKQEYRVLGALADLGQSVYRFAFDLRILQSPVIGEWAEPFGAKQVGSSAMPFKRNPINAENVNSMARHLAALPRVAWDNAAHSLLERTLDDSANRRSVLPTAFLISDELLKRSQRLIDGLTVNPRASARLMALYGPFAATERLLMQAVVRGADRQVFHELIREHALTAWAATQRGEENPLIQGLLDDPRVQALGSEEELRSWLDASDYVGDAPERALTMARIMRDAHHEENGSC